MDSTYYFVNTLGVRCQNATDTISSTASQCAVDTVSTVTNLFDFGIVLSICLTVVAVVVIITLAFNRWHKTNQENQRRLAEREHWIALKKEYQKLALEHIKVRADSTSESNPYLDYIDMFINQIDEHLKNISGK